jgi:hypothetical protein
MAYIFPDPVIQVMWIENAIILVAIWVSFAPHGLIDAMR